MTDASPIELRVLFRIMMGLGAVVLLTACGDTPCERYCAGAEAEVSALAIEKLKGGGCRAELAAFEECVSLCEAQSPSNRCIDCALAEESCGRACPDSNLESAAQEVVLGLSCWPDEEPSIDCQASRDVQINSHIRPESRNRTGLIAFAETATVVSIAPLTFATETQGEWSVDRVSSSFEVGEVVELMVRWECFVHCRSRFTAVSGSTLRMVGWYYFDPPSVPGLSLQMRRSNCRGSSADESTKVVDVDLHANETRIRPGEEAQVNGYRVLNGPSADIYLTTAISTPIDERSGFVERL